MKIAIFTQPLHTNYGGVLQNYALQKVLIKMGHNVITIDHNNPKGYKGFARLLFFCKVMVGKCLGRAENINFPLSDKKLLKKASRVTYFTDKYINHTSKCKSVEELKKMCDQINPDAIVLGSDQVWRPQYSIRPESAFLDFCDDPRIIKVAYAASFGTAEWEYTPEQTKYFQYWIKQFTAVSVREKTGIGLCKEYLGIDAVQIIDPTMLLDRSEYIELIQEERESLSRGDLLTYILDRDSHKEEVINVIAEKMHLHPFSVMVEKKRAAKYPSVTQWLRGFMDAKYVIVDSFHGAVFSIIFNKPFVVIANAIRGNTRFETLLETFGLQNRLVLEIIENNKIVEMLASPIDWVRVNAILRKEQEKADLFLRECLSDQTRKFEIPSK